MSVYGAAAYEAWVSGRLAQDILRSMGTDGVCVIVCHPNRCMEFTTRLCELTAGTPYELRLDVAYGAEWGSASEKRRLVLACEAYQVQGWEFERLTAYSIEKDEAPVEVVREVMWGMWQLRSESWRAIHHGWRSKATHPCA